MSLAPIKRDTSRRWNRRTGRPGMAQRIARLRGAGVAEGSAAGPGR